MKVDKLKLVIFEENNDLTEVWEDFFSDNRSLLGERTFYAVGDQKQSIYSFQGADIKSFYFMKNFFSK